MMNIRKFVSEDDAVSPVIGVILMVAITVILAAVIGAFVLGIGGDQSVAPQASWSITESTVTDTTGDGESVVEFTHEGGDRVEGDTYDVTAAGLPDGDWEVEDTSSDLTAGSTVDVVTDGSDPDETEFNNGDTVRLIWEDPGSDDTSVLRTHELSNQE